MLNPYLGMVFIAVMLGGLMSGLRILQTRLELHPEVVRKLMHVIMGLVTLTLPWIFHQNWPVLSLATGTALALFLLKRSRLKNNLGQVLHGVGRSSQGDVAFPLAVATVFVLAKGNTLLYAVPILILTVADATAALIGLRYGLSRFQAAEGQKSLEGSAAFFAITFNTVLLALLVFTQVGRIESILISFLLALLVMILEAIAWQGLDNFFIPLASFLLLENYISMTLSELLANLGFFLALLLLVLVLRRSIHFDNTAVMAAAVIGYLIWAAGGWLWLIPPITLFLTYTFVMPQHLRPIFSNTPEPKPAFISEVFIKHDFTLYTILSATLPGLVWLLLSTTLKQSQLGFPYMLSFAIYLCLIGLGRMNYQGKHKEQALTFLQSFLFAFILIVVPYSLIHLHPGSFFFLLLSAFAIMILVGWVFYYLEPQLRLNPGDIERWRWQGGLAGVGSLLGLVPLFLLGN